MSGQGIKGAGSDAAYDVDLNPAGHASDKASGHETLHHSTPGVAGKIDIDQGSEWDSKVVSGDATLASSGLLTITSDAVTDTKIGNRTVNPATAPGGNGPAALTTILSWFANRVKAITGGTNWWDAPAATLAALNTLLNAHHTRHEAGGADAIKLDDLATPDDNSDLNASTARHGLFPKLVNDVKLAFLGDGSWGDHLSTSGLWVAKGDMVLGSGAGAAARFAVGNDGQFPQADSNSPLGVKWVSQTPGALTVQEEDGLPLVNNVTTIKVSNNTLTNEGEGVVRISTGGGGGGGGSVDAVLAVMNLLGWA